MNQWRFIFQPLKSIAVDGLEDLKKSLALKCKLKFANLEQPMGSRLFLKPFSFLSRDENPFAFLENVLAFFMKAISL